MAVVYVIQEEGRAGRGHVKIGYSSTSAGDRLKSCQTGNPRRLVLLAAFPGTTDLEGAVHDRLQHLRLQPSRRVAGREWFRWAPEIEALLEKGVEAFLSSPPTTGADRKLRTRTRPRSCSECGGSGYTCDICWGPGNHSHGDEYSFSPCEKCGVLIEEAEPA